MKNTLMRCVLLAAFAVGISQPLFAAPGDLKLTMQDGRVTLIAESVPVRQILQEWARIGQTRIVNAEKLTGPALTVQLVNVPEREALDIVLRSAAGYIAAPRQVALAGAAAFDRITILATSRAPAATASAAPAVPTFQRPPQPVDDGDEPINVQMPPQPQSPVTTPFPGMPPQPPMGQQPPVNGVQPGPLTSPRPGALPQPQIPTGVPNPYNPGQLIRPNGPGGSGSPGGPGGPSGSGRN
jgi:hypothetical protein